MEMFYEVEVEAMVKKEKRKYKKLERASLALARKLDHFLKTGNESRDSLRASIVNFEEATGLKVGE